jgi:hypothetical protein
MKEQRPHFWPFSKSAPLQAVGEAIDFGYPAGMPPLPRSNSVLADFGSFAAADLVVLLQKLIWIDSHERSNLSLENGLGSMSDQDLGRSSWPLSFRVESISVRVMGVSSVLCPCV